MRKHRFIRNLAGLTLTSVLALGISLPISTVHADQQTVLTLDPSVGPDGAEAPVSISPYLYGANMIFKNSAGDIINNTNYQVKPAFDSALSASNITMLRYPGGTVGNTFQWTSAVGPDASRPLEIVNGPPQVAHYGVDEAMKYDAKRNIQPIYVYNWANGTPADAANLVQYLNATDDGTNSEAALRTANNPDRLDKNNQPIKTGYGVKYIEIGNEVGVHVEQKYWTYKATLVDDATYKPVSPQPTESGLYANGGTIYFSHQPVVNMYDWRNDPTTTFTDESDGTAGQSKFVNYTPLIDTRGQTVTTDVYVDGVKWKFVPDFTNSTSTSTDYTLNFTTGEIKFGDNIHGAIPPAGKAITISYYAHRDGFIQYYDAIRAVDPNIRIYSGDDRNDYIDAMNAKGANGKYDGIDVHSYAYNVDNGSDIPMDTFHDNAFLELDQRNQEFLDTLNYMKAKVGLANASTKDVITTEYGILSAKNSHDGNVYLGSLDNGIYTAASIMNRMDTNTLITMRHELSVKSPIGDGLFTIYDNADGSSQVVATPGALVFNMFGQLFGTQSIQHTLTGVDPTVPVGTSSFHALQDVASRDSSGNVYLAVLNKDRINNYSTTIKLNHFSPASGSTTVWTLNSTNFDDYNSSTNSTNVKIDKHVNDPTNPAASTSFDYTFPAHSITFIKIPGTVNTISSNLALHYNLNEQSGTVAADSSDNGLNGTLVNSPTWTADGVSGGALSFDGTNSVDTPFVLDPGTTPSFSVSAWVKRVNTNGTYQTILQQLNNGKTWLFLDSSGHLISNIGGSFLTSTTTLANNTWYQVGLTVQNNKATLYVNGVPAGSGAVTLTSDNVDGMRIGRHKSPSSTNAGWNGLIDDVRIYNWALYDSDMLALSKEQLPKAVWKLDESTGTAAPDSSGNGLNGTLVAPAAWAPTGGKYWGAVQFSGTGGSVNTPFVLNPGVTSAAFTATAWVKLNQITSSNQTILQQLGGGRSWLYVDAAGYLNTYISGSAITSAAPLSTQTWHQVGLVFQNGTATLYVDGQAAGSRMVTPTADATDGMSIGQNKTSNASWGGLIDDVRIYNNALSDLQMKDLFAGS